MAKNAYDKLSWDKKEEIIKRKLGFLSFFAVYDYIYNVNNEFIETTKLRDLLKKDDPDFPKSLDFYLIFINFPRFSVDFLRFSFDFPKFC